MMMIAIAETRPSDVRPILKQYQGKDIPKAFAASEQAALEQYQREWLEEQKKKSRGLNKWLGVGKVSGMSEEMPTELPYQRHRRLRRQLFEQQHEEEDRRFREQAKKAMQEQLEHFKKSNISILDYMTKVSQ
jgi:import inner membrane translocase subunit TIM50